MSCFESANDHILGVTGGVTMLGVLFAIMAGVCISLQNVFNTRVGDSVGSIETTVVVHAVGLVASIIMVVFLGDGDLTKIGNVDKVYLIGGALGVAIVIGVIKGVSTLGAAQAVMIVMLAQLAVAYLIDAMGLFGMDRIPVSMTKLAGLGIMLGGLFVFRLK